MRRRRLRSWSFVAVYPRVSVGMGTAYITPRGYIGQECRVAPRTAFGMDELNPERPAVPATGYPLEFDVEYPDRPLNRVSTAFRILWLIPIAIVLGLVNHTQFSVSSGDEYAGFVTAGGLLIAGPAVMILFREKYPRWWFDWNRELLRFTNRVYAYGA